MIERLNREIRRRTRVVGGFPDGNSELTIAPWTATIQSAQLFRHYRLWR